MNNEEEPLNCSICKQVYANAEGLLNHMYSHDAEDFVPCDKEFDSNVTSNEHLNFESLNDKGEPLKCSLCNQVFAHETSLRRHMMLHDEEDNSLSFVLCDKEFDFNEASNEHLKSDSFKYEGEPIQCSLCSQVFANETSLRLHMMLHNEEDNSLSFVSCAKEFDFNEASNEHLKSDSFNNEGEPLQCSFCSQVFSDEISLGLHMMLHNEEGDSLSFDPCDKEFDSNEASNEHLKSESFGNGEPVQCLLCIQVFANTQGLQVHMWSHAESFPLFNTVTLVCGKCNEDVGTIENMQKHKCIYDEDPDREEKLGFMSGPFFFTGKDSEQHIDGGNSSEVLDWGNSSEVVDWGNSSEVVDWGNSSEVVNWGNSSEVVNWGNSSEVVDLGNSSEVVDLGNSSEVVDWGNSSEDIEGGNTSKAVDGGNSFKAVYGENFSKAMDGGNSSKAEDEGMETIERLENFQWFYNEHSDMEEEFSFVGGLFFSEVEDSENPPLQHVDGGDFSEADKVEDEHFPCHLCTLVFDTLEELATHLKSDPFHKEGEMHPCTLCSQHFATKASLNNHMWVHDEGFPLFNIDKYMCPKCYVEMEYENKEKHKCVPNDDSDVDMLEEYVVRGPGPV